MRRRKSTLSKKLLKTTKKSSKSIFKTLIKVFFPGEKKLHAQRKRLERINKRR